MKPIPLTSDVAVVALLGFCVWETHKAFREAVPEIKELRSCTPGSDEYFSNRQVLVDADITVGMVALGAGIMASYMTRSLEPVILVMATLGAVAWYHHSILGSDPV